jgi:phosphoglycolate phosphatase
VSQPLRNLRAAAIDLDGTLIHTLPDFALASNRMLAELGLPPVGEAQLGEFIGKGAEHLIISLLNHAVAIDYPAHTAMYLESNVAAQLSVAQASFQRHYAAINGQYAEVYPGVLPGLDWLQERGFKLACLTNKPLAFAQGLLAQKGLAHYFSQVFGGDSFARKKPDPLPLLKTCEALGTLPAHTLMLGDSSNDAQAARAAGCPVLLVRYGYNHGQSVLAVDCDGTLDSMAELPQWLG